jgi:predicted Zn-dependent peptidase
MRVIAVEQPHLHSANLSFLVRSGSRHEREEEWGLAHLVEHMLYRGSAEFPSTRDLARVFERSGGMLDGSTWRDHTSLATPMHPSYLAEALRALHDMVQRPKFSDLELERSIVEEELRADLDEKGRDVDISNVSRASIWQGHPLGRRIAGSFETLESFERADLERYHAERFVGANIALCVAGKIEKEQVFELAERTFGALPRGNPTLDGSPAHFGPPSRVCTYEREASQLEVQLTFESLPDPHDDFTALLLLAKVLDDGLDSRLHQAVCERRGLVYELSTGLDCYADCGLYDIEMSVAPGKALAAVGATLEALEEICTNGVSEEELAFVRQKSLHEVEFTVDSAADMADWYAGAALFGRPGSLGDAAGRIYGVTAADLTRLARKVFQSGKLHATVMGPLRRANMRRLKKLFEGFSRPKK